MIKRVIIGCAKDVILAETKFYRDRRLPPKPSKRTVSLASIQALNSLLSGTGYQHRPYPDIKSRLEKIGLGSELIDPPNVNRAFRTYRNIGYFQREKGKSRKDGLPGRNIVYKETELITDLRELVSRLKPRCIIYRTLARCGMLERYLRVFNYSDLIKRKHIDVKNATLERRIRTNGPIEQKQIDEFEKGYRKDQEFLKGKSNREILSFVCKISRIQMFDRHKLWHSDTDYTNFFIRGGIAYNEVNVIYPTF